MNPVAPPRPLSPNAGPAQSGPSTSPATSGLFERLKIDRQKAMPLLFAGAILLLFGIVFFGSRLLKKEETTTNPETEAVNSLLPPSARTATAPNQPSGGDKYSTNYKAGRLNPSSTSEEARELARQQAEALSGQSMTVRSYHTNEGVTLPAEQAVPTLAPTYRPPAKSATQQSLQQDILAHQRENQQTIQTLYGNRETKAERAARLAEEEEKRYNRQQRERLMTMTERAMEAQSNASAGRGDAGSSPDQLPGERPTLPSRFGATEGSVLQMDTYHRVKALSGNQLSPYQKKVFAREIDAEARGESGVTTAVHDPGKGVRTSVESDEGVGFIGTGGKRVARSQNASTRNLSIPAVIHGDADNVVVQPGGTVAIRLIQDTQLLLNGELVFMPAQTLLAGTCSLNGERVQIRVTNIRQGAYLYSTDLDVYDLDGQVGIRVPGLADKTAASQTLVQASQGAANPMMLIPQGSAANQIGTQVGVQAASSLFNGVRQYAMTKLSSTRVTIRPNYQVFLKAGGSSAGRRSNKTFALDEE